MRKALPIIIIVLVLVVGGGIYAATRPDSTDNGTSTASMDTNKQDESTNNTSESSQATDQVTIKDMSFSPSDITVKKGTTVTWTNQDSMAHTVTEIDSKQGPNSDTLNPGQTYTFTFDKTGTFKYNCSIHPNMKGTVTVTE